MKIEKLMMMSLLVVFIGFLFMAVGYVIESQTLGYIALCLAAAGSLMLVFGLFLDIFE
jgi:hypothetical protein